MKTVPGITISPLQIPIVILNPRAEPKTRAQRATMIESAHETVLYPEDLQHIDRQGMPVVIGYNGIDHFVPSIILSTVEYNQWKLEILVKLSEASLDVLEDIDLSQVSPEISAHLGTLKQNLSTTTELCSERTLPTVAAAAAKVRRAHGPLFGQVPGASGSPPQSPVPSSQVSSGSRPAKRKRKESKIHQCLICGVQKTRKADMDDHLSVEHQMGTSRKCNICGKLLKLKKV